MKNTIKVASVVFFVGALVAFGLTLTLKGVGGKSDEGQGYAPVQMSVDPIQPSGKVVESAPQAEPETPAEPSPAAKAVGETDLAEQGASGAAAAPAPQAPPDQAAPEPAAEVAAPVATEPAAPAETVPAEAKPAPATPAGGIVESVAVDASPASFVLTLTCSAEPGAVKGFYLADRNKYVIDMAGDWRMDKKNVLRVTGGSVRHVVVGEHPGSFIRLAVQLARKPSAAPPEPAVEVLGKVVTVSVALP